MRSAFASVLVGAAKELVPGPRLPALQVNKRVVFVEAGAYQLQSINVSDPTNPRPYKVPRQPRSLGTLATEAAAAR